jgi:putative transposase
MNLYVNSLIEWISFDENEKSPTIERVLYNDSKFIVTINIFTKTGLPIIRRFDEIDGVLRNGGIRILEVEPFANLLIPEDSIPEKHKKYRNDAWEIIQEIVELRGLKAFNPSIRGRLIAKICIQFEVKKKVVYNHLKSFWKRGITKNALLPNFRNCGGKGKRRTGESIHAKKLGNKSAVSDALGQDRGIRMTLDVKRHFRRGLDRFYYNTKKRSLRSSYQLTIEAFFNTGYELKGDIAVPVIPSIEVLPTFRQFRYYYETEYRNPVKETKARNGETQFQLINRELFGNSTDMAFGPGSQYQIDATIVDLYLVSSFDRTKIIGRPVLYLVVDVFSRMIVGMAVMLEGPSWVGGMLALDNAFSDKVAFCAENGIEITNDQWNCHHIPEAILADRGEFEGYNADNLVGSLRIVVQNTPPYRGDLKGIVERQFRILNDNFVRFEPGAVIKHRDRSQKDYRLDATLTLKDFQTIMICHIFDHNNDRYLKSYRKDEFMIADNLERYPRNLWEWGIQNRSGHQRDANRNVVRMNLLPRKEVTVTAKGLHFERELFYACDPIYQAGLMMRKSGSKATKVTIAYDPRNTDYIYLPSLDNREVTICPLTSASKTFLGRNLYEAQAYFNQETQNADLSREKKIKSRATFHAIQSHVTDKAINKTSEALKNVENLTKSKRTKNIRENRADERMINRNNNIWDFTDETAISSDSNINEVVFSENDEDESCVPITSTADNIRAIRRKIRGENVYGGNQNES